MNKPRVQEAAHQSVTTLDPNADFKYRQGKSTN